MIDTFAEAGTRIVLELVELELEPLEIELELNLSV